MNVLVALLNVLISFRVKIAGVDAEIRLADTRQESQVTLFKIKVKLPIQYRKVAITQFEMPKIFPCLTL